MNSQIIAQTIVRLCAEKGISANQMLQEAHLSKSFVDNLKKGSMPSVDKICAVADYFHVTVDFLLGKEEAQPNNLSVDGLCEHEKKVVEAYRSRPDLQATVDRLLGIRREGQVLLWEAAQSDDKHPPKVIYMSKERWEKIQSAPDTDDTLL